MAAQQPLTSFRSRTSSGRVEVAVWENEHDDNTHYSVSVKKSYKDGDGYQEAKSLLEGDVLIVSRLLGKAWDFIQEQRQSQ